VPKNRFSEDPEQRIEAMAQALNAPFVSSALALRETRSAQHPLSNPLYIPGDDTHLNAQGHGIVAGSFESVIDPILQGSSDCTF